MRTNETAHILVSRSRKTSALPRRIAKIAAMSAALFLSSTSLAGAAVLGYIDGITQVGTDYLLGGWACDTGVNASISVHVYVGGPAGTGTGVAIATANKSSETAISTRCQTTGVSHRFSIPIPLAVRREHQGKAIYVHGISQSGGANLAIDNSGEIFVPAPISLTRRYFYDGNERLCAMVEPETGTQFYQYDAAGNLIRTVLSTTTATGCLAGSSSDPAIDRTFDQRGRLKTLELPDGKGDQVWTYAPDNLPASVAVMNPNVTNPTKTTYTYNRRRLLTGEGLSHLGGTTAWGAGYGYTANGDLSVITYPSGFSIDYAPNALGQPTKAGAYASSVKYHPNGAIASFTYGNGITHTMTQNDRQLPAKSVDSGSVLDDDYGYDKNGNVDHKWDNATGGASGRTMQYDGLDRLVQAFSPAFGGDNYAYYTYDGLDNIRTAKAHGNDYTYVYDAKWRLTNITNTVGGASVIGLGYDARGNLANKNGQTYTFDYGNRLRSSVSPSSYWYAYDGQGRRVLSCSPTACNYQMYSQAGQLLMTQDNRDSTRTESIYLGGSLVALHELNTTTGVVTAKYQHTDALGSPVAITDASGNVIERSSYNPYGKLLNRPLKDGPGYAGHASDAATGLSYMQQRYYDPQVGRFLSVDPVTANTGTGGNFNRYWYARNNPYRFSDPDGRRDRETYEGMRDDRGNQERLRRERAENDIASALMTFVAEIPAMLEMMSPDSVGSGFGDDMALIAGPMSREISKLAPVESRAVGRVATAKEVTVPASRYPQSAAHIRDAQAAGQPSVLTINRGGAAANRRASLAGTPPVRGVDRDEYPPAMFLEGGHGASVRYIDPSDNRGAGSCIGAQCRGLPDGSRIIIRVDDELSR